MKKSIFLLVLLFCSISAFSQDEYHPKTVVSIVPQYILNHGLRVDFERQISTKQFIQLCPVIYIDGQDGGFSLPSNQELTSVYGGGLSIYHKLFALENFETFGLYMSYGISYSYYDIEFWDNSSYSDIGWMDTNGSANINKIGADILFGYQMFYKEGLSLDIYGGMGTRLSKLNTSGSNDDIFNYFPWEYNYTGNAYQMGVRIGFIFQ